jgi:hypothetical protein
MLINNFLKLKRKIHIVRVGIGLFKSFCGSNLIS